MHKCKGILDSHFCVGIRLGRISSGSRYQVADSVGCLAFWGVQGSDVCKVVEFLFHLAEGFHRGEQPVLLAPECVGCEVRGFHLIKSLVAREVEERQHRSPALRFRICGDQQAQTQVLEQTIIRRFKHPIQCFVTSVGVKIDMHIILEQT